MITIILVYPKWNYSYIISLGEKTFSKMHTSVRNQFAHIKTFAYVYKNYHSERYYYKFLSLELEENLHKMSMKKLYNTLDHIFSLSI